MADSKRLRVLKALTSLLEATPGYNLGGKVWRGRRNPGDETETPFLIMFELPPEFEQRADLSVRAMPWFIGLQGYTDVLTEHLTDEAHNFMAAVKKQLSRIVDDGGVMSPGPDYMLGGLVADLQIDGGLVFSPDETTNCSFFVVKLTFGITENLDDPYEAT